MATSRYSNSPMIDFKHYGIPDGYKNIKEAIDSGEIETNDYVTKPLDRLDILAFQFYGDGRLWWIIAMANDVGWGLQVTNGRTLRIPTSSDAVIDRI